MIAQNSRKINVMGYVPKLFEAIFMKILSRNKAEGTGFEPVPPFQENGFRNRRF
jgi:hypothetical protein